MSASHQPQKLTLHEAISRRFDKTPQGSIFTKDLKTIYSLTIICLNLTEKPPKLSKISFLSKHFPFSFTVQEAIDTMANLTSSIESSATKTTISYAIKKDLAIALLKKFMVAKLLHTPADRTRSEPKEKVLLQPTPKGVGVLQKYIKTFGLKDVDKISIIKTNFNSMDVFTFERSSVTDTIVYSEYFVHLLFDKFLGPSQNVWRPGNPPDKIPSLDHRLEIDDEFDFSNFQNESFQLPNYYQDQFRTNETQPPPSKSIIPLVGKNSASSSSSRTNESPFAHNFFTNPESDSHIQYYVSNKGVRLYENQKFGSNITIRYCFNAKAGWQWLMDCTDIMYPHEATMILNLFYKYDLIEPIILPPSSSTSKRNFLPLKTSFYTFSKKGLEISHWTHDIKRKINVADDEDIIKDASILALSNHALTSTTPINSSDDELPNQTGQLDIYKVLNDPGMRYLFREHLSKEHCAENLDVYIDIKHFSKKMAILKNVFNAFEQQKEIMVDSKTIKPPSKRNAVKLINECLSSVYNIYSSYISVGAPSQINIDHSLREKIKDTMLQPTSPLKPTFDMIIPPEPAYIPKQRPTSFEQTIPQTLDPTTSQLPVLEVISPAESINSTNGKFNNKNLSIDVISNQIHSTTDVPTTPTQEEMKRSLEILYKLFPLIELVGQQILKMLAFDSFTKFISSETFLEANH